MMVRCLHRDRCEEDACEHYYAHEGRMYDHNRYCYNYEEYCETIGESVECKEVFLSICPAYGNICNDHKCDHAEEHYDIEECLTQKCYAAWDKKKQEVYCIKVDDMIVNVNELFDNIEL